jgi:hypothetical protein
MDLQDKTKPLPRYTSLGCYPILYLTHREEVLCCDCASDNRRELNIAGINWENPHVYCDECSERIESAYADDDEGDDHAKA